MNPLKLRLALSVVAALAIAAPAIAQGNTSRSPRFEIGLAVGIVRPAVVIDEPGGLRARPIATGTGDSHRIVETDIVGRVAWHRRTSTVVSIGWLGEASRDTL